MCEEKKWEKTLVQLLVVSQSGWCVRVLFKLVKNWARAAFDHQRSTMWGHNIKRSRVRWYWEEQGKSPNRGSLSPPFDCVPSFHRCTLVNYSCWRLNDCHAIKSFPMLTWPRSPHVERFKGKKRRQFSQCILWIGIRIEIRALSKNIPENMVRMVPNVPQMILCIISQIWKGADNSEKLDADPSWTFWPGRHAIGPRNIPYCTQNPHKPCILVFWYYQTEHFQHAEK